jgi:YceI-like domain
MPQPKDSSPRGGASRPRLAGSASARLALRRSCLAAMLMAGVTLAGCAVQAPRPPEGQEQGPSGFPADFYRQSAQRGLAVFEIDSAASLVVLEVRRGGPLARLGHDHAIASHNVRGYIAPGQGRADLFIRLDELVVDEPQLRADAGFDTQPDAAAIAGTRRNMLAQLHAGEHPYAVISMEDVDADAAEASVNASIALNGLTRAVRVPVHIEHGPDELRVRGKVALEQSDFGIVPLAILGGGLMVQDRVDVRFEIRARRARPSKAG